MVRNLLLSVGALVVALLVVSDADACHRRRSCGNGGCGSSGYSGYGAAYGAGYADYGAGYAGYGYDSSGRYVYNPGGIGGPASGLGVRPGAGFGAPGVGPGGIGGPASGIGVRPGAGAGGAGRRR